MGTKDCELRGRRVHVAFVHLWCWALCHYGRGSIHDPSSLSETSLQVRVRPTTVGCSPSLAATGSFSPSSLAASWALSQGTGEFLTAHRYPFPFLLVSSDSCPLERLDAGHEPVGRDTAGVGADEGATGLTSCGQAVWRGPECGLQRENLKRRRVLEFWCHGWLFVATTRKGDVAEGGGGGNQRKE